MINRKAKGARRERQAQAILEKLGYLVTKAGASLGAFDLIAVAKNSIKLVQVKSNRPPGRIERETLTRLSGELSGSSQVELELWIFKDGSSTPLKRLITP